MIKSFVLPAVITVHSPLLNQIVLSDNTTIHKYVIYNIQIFHDNDSSAFNSSQIFPHIHTLNDFKLSDEHYTVQILNVHI